MDAREAVRRLQENREDDGAIGGVLSNQSVLRADDASSLADWITSQRRSVRARAHLVEALLKDNPDDHDRFGSVAEGVDAIATGGRVVVVSHQPTMLAYTGVFAQFLLAHWLATTLTATDGRPATVVYLCLDSDDAFDRRIKTAHMPMPVARGGHLSISAPIPTSCEGRVHCRVPAPSRDSVKSWAAALEGGFGRCASLLPGLRSELVTVRRRIEDRLFGLCGTAVSRHGTFSEFSRSVLMTFVEQVIGQRPLILRLSTACGDGREMFEGLLSRFDSIRSEAAAASAVLAARGVALRSQGLLSHEAGWLICDACGRRTPLGAERAAALVSRTAAADCKWCAARITPDSAASVIPRILIEDLFGATFTDASVVLTYAGSAEHVLLAQWTHRAMFGTESPIYTWHPKQRLGDVIDNASLALSLNDNALRAEATSALRLAWNGRDSLVHSLGVQDLVAYGDSWSAFFAAQRLTDSMVFGEPAEVPAALAGEFS